MHGAADGPRPTGECRVVIPGERRPRFVCRACHWRMCYGVVCASVVRLCVSVCHVRMMSIAWRSVAASSRTRRGRQGGTADAWDGHGPEKSESRFSVRHMLSRRTTLSRRCTPHYPPRGKGSEREQIDADRANCGEDHHPLQASDLARALPRPTAAGTLPCSERCGHAPRTRVACVSDKILCSRLAVIADLRRP